MLKPTLVLMAAGLAIAGCAGAPAVTAPPRQAPAPASQTPKAAPVQAPQGIAVGEPTPGERVMDSSMPAAPCIEAFTTLDANGDGALSPDEWNADRDAGGAAAFRAKDTNGDGRIDSIEFCQ